MEPTKLKLVTAENGDVVLKAGTQEEYDAISKMELPPFGRDVAPGAMTIENGVAHFEGKVVGTVTFTDGKFCLDMSEAEDEKVAEKLMALMKSSPPGFSIGGTLAPKPDSAV